MANAKDIRITKFPVTINGEEKHLVFDLNAFIEIEDQYGDIDKAMAAVEKGSMKALRLLIWAGLLNSQPDITLQEVGGWFDIAGITDLSSVLYQGLGANMPNKVTEVERKGQNLDPNSLGPVNVLAKPPIK